MAQSLFKACKSVIRDGISGTKNVGGHDVFIELYTQKDIDDDVYKLNTKQITRCSFGDEIEDNVVLVADDTITIPEGYTLWPTHPKKSLVIMCNKFINNGSVSMYQGAPNVLPHDWFIFSKVDGNDQDIIIPAYHHNEIPIKHWGTSSGTSPNSQNGNSAPLNSRLCGSGGVPAGGGSINYSGSSCWTGASGQGYAFGGGAGAGAANNTSGNPTNNGINASVSSEYPMRGGNACQQTWSKAISGGVGNPIGTCLYGATQNFGCGGRIIIYCIEFINNGTIAANGTSAKTGYYGIGASSGGGAIDLFYTFTESEDLSSSINVSGGKGYGNGGDGCFTPLRWNKDIIVKPREKYMSKDNMIYFLGELVKRINND